MKRHRMSLTDTVFVGENESTKLNVLIGANSATGYITELEKIAKICESSLPVTIITDLSLYRAPRGEELWRRISQLKEYVASTVPVYQAVQEDCTISPQLLLDLIQEQAENGVKLMTIHPTPSFDLLELSRKRYIPITSRGGATVCRDMIVGRNKENVYIQILDEVLKIAKANHVAISIGSSFRSATIKDGNDRVFLSELGKQIDIAKYCYERGVETIIETPGHVSPQHIYSICEILKNCNPFPIMPLGPLPTDCALEQDDLAGCIGAVLMGTNDCADILTVVTREEHSGSIPTIESIISAIKKYVVAKHIIDIYKLGDTKADNMMSLQRSKHFSCIVGFGSNCDRCSNLCPLRFGMEYL